MQNSAKMAICIYRMRVTGNYINNKNYETQKNLGANVLKLNIKQTLEIFNEIDLEVNLNGIKGAFFGPKDGRLDLYSVLQGFIKKAKSLGAEYVYDEVTEIAIKNH